jgi:hypothetical protein
MGAVPFSTIQDGFRRSDSAEVDASVVINCEQTTNTYIAYAS